MSHVVTVKTAIRDPEVVLLACRRLGFAEPKVETVRMYDKSEATGLAVRLPGWRYPVVCDATGELRYDNYEGKWGAQAELNRFQQAYATEAAKLTAMRRGWQVSEERMGNGSVRLVVTGAGL